MSATPFVFGLVGAAVERPAHALAVNEQDGTRCLTREELTDLLAELLELRELATKVRSYPQEFHAVEGLYYGPAAGLIDRIVDRVENAFCEALAVKAFEPYEGDGGLEDAIRANAYNVLTAAGMIDRQTGENLLDQVKSLRRLLADIYVALLAAGWRDDELVRRVKLASTGVVTTADELAAARKRIEELANGNAHAARVILAHDAERIDAATRIARLEAELAETRKELAAQCQRRVAVEEDLAAERFRADANAHTLRKYGAECFPELVNGQMHFVRSLMESVAEDITAVLDKSPEAAVQRAADVAELFKYKDRLVWLHTGGGRDAAGCEWGVFRVKWDANGQPVEVFQTNSDFSDLDAEMAREHSAPNGGAS